MHKLLRQIAKVGLCTEPPPQPNEEWRILAERLGNDVLQLLGRALAIRHVDAGSCNGCELEINALGNPYYNLEALGIKFVASPRHADLLLVTAPVSKNMEEALRRTYDATPAPKLRERIEALADEWWLAWFGATKKGLEEELRRHEAALDRARLRRWKA